MSMYLDVVGIAGESLSPVPNWKDKIDDNSMGYDVSQKTSLEAGSGLVASGAIFGPMQISKVMDKSTPLLWSKLCAGEPIATVTIRVSRPGANAIGPAGGLFEAEKYIMENVVVTSYHTSGSPGPGGLPMESWSLAFTAITEVYRTVDAKGNLQAAQTEGWDINGNLTHTAPGSAMGNPS
ncbi:MAG: type VI secretion system tube protein Hcp [Bryobacteraceae bacterium]|jgi:type VI secretion system secreted protein Hcp